MIFDISALFFASPPQFASHPDPNPRLRTMASKLCTSCHIIADSELGHWLWLGYVHSILLVQPPNLSSDSHARAQLA